MPVVRSDAKSVASYGTQTNRGVDMRYLTGARTLVTTWIVLGHFLDEPRGALAPFFACAARTLNRGCRVRSR